MSVTGDDIPASLAEAMAEIRRLRGQVGEARLSTYVPPEYVAVEKARFDEMAAEIERLRARVHELAAALATIQATHTVTFGTLEQPTPDEPATYTHNVPPSAPPHNE